MKKPTHHKCPRIHKLRISTYIEASSCASCSLLGLGDGLVRLTNLEGGERLEEAGAVLGARHRIFTFFAILLLDY